MFGIVGIVVIFIMVFGGYVLAGGKMGIILKSLPFEMIMIAGAATGTFLLSNDMSSVRHTLKDIAKVFKGPKWMPEDYRNLRDVGVLADLPALLNGLTAADAV